MQAVRHTYVGLLDSPREDEKVEMLLRETEDGNVLITLRSIARSELGWYPQKTLIFHPQQLQALEILVKRARGLLEARPSSGSEARGGRAGDPQVVELPFFGCPAVAE